MGTVNLGGYIPTNLNFNAAEWYPDLYPLQINPVFAISVGGALAQFRQEAGRRVGAHTPLAEPPLNLPITRPQPSQVPTIGGGRPGDLRNRTMTPSPSDSQPSIGTQGIPAPFNIGDIMGQLAMPRFDAPSNPGNNVNPNAVNMANLPLFYRELVLTPKRQIQQGEIRLAYDLGVVSSSGFRANSRRMRPVSENDVGGRFFVGDFEFRRSPNPGWTFTLPGNVVVEVDLSGVSFSPEMLADGTRWRAVGGTITPRLPEGGLRYTYAGFTMVLSQIRFELSPAEQQVKLEGAIELPEAFTQAMGSTERAGAYALT